MAPLIGRFYNDRANGRASLACKDLLLLANGRAQAKRKCPVVQTLLKKQCLSFCMKTRGHLQGAPFRGLIKIQCLLPLREMWFYSFCLLASMKIVDNNSLLGAKQETA